MRAAIVDLPLPVGPTRTTRRGLDDRVGSAASTSEITEARSTWALRGYPRSVSVPRALLAARPSTRARPDATRLVVGGLRQAIELVVREPRHRLGREDALCLRRHARSSLT